MTLEPFPVAARRALDDRRVRSNLMAATTTIREKRAAVVAELPDWDELRDAGAAAKATALDRLAELLPQLEASVERAGGVVHWARDGAEANAIVVDLVRDTGETLAVKTKSLATDEIRLNDALADAGVEVVETDLAELVCQLAGDRPSHLLVPAIHKSRAEIRDLLRDSLDLPDLGDDPAELTAAARDHLRAVFLRARVAISGGNVAVAETGTIGVVESEGNGRMCTTLPETLITVLGIEKVVARWSDLDSLLQLLPRSSTGERMNPYTSFWTGVHPGDGPSAFHLVLLDNGRTDALADPVGRDALRCIRCSACLNVCPVYRQVGGHAYQTVYAGPIGAILQPQLAPSREARTLPFASSLCGACADVCPVRIDIPRLLVHGRALAVAVDRQGVEGVALRRLGRVFSSRSRYERAQRLARVLQRPLTADGWFKRFPGPLAGWGASRELPAFPAETFREWWARERGA